MEENKIKSVQKGVGEGALFYSTDQNVSLYQRVDEIKEEQKNATDYLEINVYRGYINNRLIFEMGIDRDVTVIFWYSYHSYKKNC